MRSQAFRRPAGQAVTLDGSILRVNPDTGAASAGNPAISDANPNRRRIVAHGFRNPFRITFRPGTGEIWSGDVGWNEYEEINRTQNIAQVRNYGWPCYEGTPRMGSYDTLNINSCETLYSQGAGAVTAPYYAYRHAEQVVSGRGVPDRLARRSPACTSTRARRSRPPTATRCSSATTRATASGSPTRAPTGCRT